MKKFFMLLIAAIFMGILIFIILHWIFSVEINMAVTLAISCAISALVIEYLKPYFIAQGKKQQEDIYKRVTRNLGKRNKHIQQ
ncbi:MAG: hypothetical protein ACR2KB_01475 [Chitinophagaceae bacterium]|jgi:membrane protein implicated in regulation of membrane protease activity